MRTRRRTYTAETPAPLFPEALTVKRIAQALPAAATRKRKLKSGSKMKKFTSFWDLYIPSDLLKEILSRLGLKANIRASAVCKTWCEAAVSVRKLQPRPWLFFLLDDCSPTGSPYTLFDPLRSQTYTLDFPDLNRDHTFSYSKDGWLLVLTGYPSIFSFFLNPFTRERIYLPKGPGYSSGYYLAFSAAPTSSSCLVIQLTQQSSYPCFLVHTWRPGETKWTMLYFEKQQLQWTRCIFSNGMFYWLSACGHLGVFDPSRKTWNVLPIKPCPADFARPVLMTEHEGDIFVMYTCGKNYLPVFKLNLERKVWEEKRELGGLTVFAGYPASFTRSGISAEESNVINELFSIDKRFRPPWRTVWSARIAWVDPPHNVTSSELDRTLSL